MDRKSLALRGIVAVIFGILAIAATQFTLDFLVYMFGFFAIISGILNAGVGISSERSELPKWLLVTTGVLGILLGIFALLTPLIIAMTITMFIAAWALMTGVSDLGLALSNKTAPHRALLALSGIIGILFAIILVLTPILGAYALVIVLGIYALVFGFISIFLGLSMGREKVVVETKTVP
ncbi:MAG: HdeD family acid-resistance protein [Methanoregula sp.]|nr:HdeD family acid-resistance protein [Methanoregula sp.]